MKFTTSSEELKKAVSLTTHLCGGNITLPILNNILLSVEKETLQVSSTNLELGLLVSFPVKTEKEGKITIPGRILSDFISSLPKGEITIKEKGLAVEIKCGSFKAKILGQDAKDFPVLPELKEKSITNISSQSLSNSFLKINHIVSPSDTRVEISGVLAVFERKRIKLVGTDSIRLGEKIIELLEDVDKKSVIIPQRTASEAAYIFSSFEGKVGIAIDPSQIAFRFSPDNNLDPEITLISRLIEGEYPDYKEIIPKEIKTQAILDKEDFQRKIKTASLFSSRIQDVKFKIEPEKNYIQVSASSSEIGEGSSKITGKIEGKPLEINLNWKYLLDGLEAIKSSEVFFGANDSSSPTILKPVGDKTYLYILMPKTV